MFDANPLHPLIVHAPLVLLPAAVVFKVADLVFPRAGLRWSALLLLLAGAVMIIAAKQTGESAAYQARMMNGAVLDITVSGPIPRLIAEGHLLHTHALLGEWARNLFVSLLLAEGVIVLATHPAFARQRRGWTLSRSSTRFLNGFWMAGSIVGLTLIVMTGYYGGALVYDHGVGVRTHSTGTDPDHAPPDHHGASIDPIPALPHE